MHDSKVNNNTVSRTSKKFLDKRSRIGEKMRNEKYEKRVNSIQNDFNAQE